MTSLTRLALRAYPPSFRARYGEELAALVEDLPASGRTSADLFRGAARAWVRPAVAEPGRRLQATLATTWVAWCAGFLVAPAINRALLDPPSAGTSAGVRGLLNAAYALFFAGWAFVLIGAAVLGFRALVPAVRSRSWAALRPLLPAVLLGAAEALGLLWLALAHVGRAAHPSGAAIAGVALWGIGFLAFVCSLGIGPAVTLGRLATDAPVLRSAARLTLPVALVLAALTGCSLAATVMAGDAALVGSGVPVAAALAVACLASLVALVSSGRGVHALRAG